MHMYIIPVFIKVLHFVLPFNVSFVTDGADPRRGGHQGPEAVQRHVSSQGHLRPPPRLVERHV